MGGVTLKSVSERQRLCEGLERKLAQQKSLEQAAEEMGVPLNHAEEVLQGVRLSRAKTSDDHLELFAAEALKTALHTLKKAMKEGNREVSVGHGEGSFTKEAVIDVDAAKALLRAGLDAQKILDRRRARAKSADGKGGDRLPGERDLFDGNGPWAFKTRD